MHKTTDQMKFTILDDPLIHQMMRADGVSRSELSELLTEVSAQLPRSTSASNLTWLQHRTFQAMSQLRFA